MTTLEWLTNFQTDLPEELKKVNTEIHFSKSTPYLCNMILFKNFNKKLSINQIGIFEVIEEGKDSSIEFYNNWVEDVKKTVPKERLLIFNVKEGWEPLCTFLDVPIPDQPFPRTNDTAQMNSNMLKGKIEAIFWFVGLPIMFGLLLYYFSIDNSGTLARQNFPRVP